MKLLNKIIKCMLIIILIAAICSVVYLVVIHNPGEGYTEFYVLDSNGNISNYPTNVTQYSINKLYIGITNHESQDENYTVKIQQNNTTLVKYNKSLQDNQKIETPYYFDVTEHIGDNQVINIELFKGNNPAPYRSLNIRYNVTN